MAEVKRLIIGMSGASGSRLAWRLLQVLSACEQVETYLIMSEGAKRTWSLEMDIPLSDLLMLCDYVLPVEDISACCASGSFEHAGMIVVPCSMKSIAAIANGYAENLLLRSADVTIKEQRPLLLMFRENPLSAVHLENLCRLSRIPAVHLMPMMMTYYQKPQTIEEMEDALIGKLLHVFHISYDRYNRWQQNP